MAKRGRPKGSLNKKTLEKIAKTAVKEESLPSAVDDAADVMSGYEPKSKLSPTQEKILKGPDVKETKTRTVKDLPRNPSVVEILGLVEETKGKQSKVDILKQFTDRNDVKYALKAAFDPRVVYFTRWFTRWICGWRPRYTRGCNGYGTRKIHSCVQKNAVLG